MHILQRIFYFFMSQLFQFDKLAEILKKRFVSTDKLFPDAPLPRMLADCDMRQVRRLRQICPKSKSKYSYILHRIFFFFLFFFCLPLPVCHFAERAKRAKLWGIID